MSKRLISRLPLALLLLLGAGAANTAPNADAQARYQKERAACTQGQTQQSQRDCLREAEAAYAELRRGKMDEVGTPDARNSIMRCDVHTGDERLACLARMQGQGSTSGSAATGGILRESTVRRVGDEPPVVVEPRR
jgi:hypothetical protein